MAIRFDLGLNLDLEFSRSNMEFPISQPMHRNKPNITYLLTYYISAKSGPIATKRKANVSIEFQASNVTNGFDLDHNLDV